MRAFALPALVAVCLASATACCVPASRPKTEPVAAAPLPPVATPEPNPAAQPPPPASPETPIKVPATGPAGEPPVKVDPPAPPPPVKAQAQPDEAVAKTERKAKRREKYAAEIAAKNEASRAGHTAEVARLTAAHQKRTEQYAAAKKAYDDALPAYKAAKAEFDAATDLAEARTPYGASPGLKEVYRKKQRAIVAAYPGTQGAADAAMLLKGGAIPKRKLPPDPVRPGLPKKVPALELPEAPEPIPVVYPPDPEEVEAARLAAAQAEAARKAAEIAARGPTRENYHRIKTGMSLAEAQDILGPGRETSRSPGFQSVSWQSRGGAFERITIISITFRNGGVYSKSIIGP